MFKSIFTTNICFDINISHDYFENVIFDIVYHNFFYKIKLLLLDVFFYKIRTGLIVDGTRVIFNIAEYDFSWKICLELSGMYLLIIAIVSYKCKVIAYK